jgi:uncharacterized protein (TIGR01370 family)
MKKEIIKSVLLSATLCFFVSCGGGGSDDDGNVNQDTPQNELLDAVEEDTRNELFDVGDSFEWRLDNIDSSAILDAKVVDVDAFSTSKRTVTSLHIDGKVVIAYLSVGTMDIQREDASDFPPEILGKPYPDFPDERFIDIRQIDKIKPIITKRLDLIKEKGFDGIEPDNIDLYAWDEDGKNATGFSIEQAENEKYIDFIIDEARKRGLSVGQKNATDLSEKYVNKFDWVLVESAFKLKFEDDVKIYPQKGKPVFAVEYTDITTEEEFLRDFCPKAKELKYTAILKDRDLTGFIRRCP